jgi:hypothetical protein
MVLGDEESELRLKTVLREAAINSTLDHANIVSTYTYNMQPLGVADASQASIPPVGQLGWLVRFSLWGHGWIQN